MYLIKVLHDLEAFIRKSKFKDTVKLNVFVLSLMKSKKLGET